MQNKSNKQAKQQHLSKNVATLDALLKAEIKKKNTSRILLAVQAKDKSKLDYRRSVAGPQEGTSAVGSVDDPFFVASITKLMTSAVIFQLVDEGKVSLDDPMAKHLPAAMIARIHVFQNQDYSSKITLRHLLHQTSGLPDFFLQKDKATGMSVHDHFAANSDQKFTRDDYLRMARDLPPRFAPSSRSGKRSFYSDTNFQLLGAVIEAVTDLSIAQNFSTRIFQPLGLDSSRTYVYDVKQEGAQRVSPIPLRYKDKEISLPHIMTSFPADGAVVSTVGDLLVFLRAYLDGRLFDKKHHTDTIQTQWNKVLAPPIQYGVGLMRFKVPDWMTFYCFRLPAMVGHSGSNASFCFYCPEKEVFVVGTFNQCEQEERPFSFMLQVVQSLQL